jgi:hypothetical protein
VTAYDTEIEAVARRLLGTSNAKLSSGEELRFGSHGSMSVVIAGPKAGTWYDFERQVGGGVKELLELYGERDPKPSRGRHVVKTYDYLGEAGELLSRCCVGVQIRPSPNNNPAPTRAASSAIRRPAGRR